MFSLLRSFGARRMTQLVRRAPTTVHALAWRSLQAIIPGTVAKLAVVAGPAPGCMCVSAAVARARTVVGPL
jgi:hypothetical protein